MKLILSMDLDNAAFEDGGAEEVGRILSSVAERIPDPLGPTSGKLSMHDANGNYCGEVVIVENSPSPDDMERALFEIHRLLRGVQVHPDARNWVQAVRANITKLYPQLD